MTGNIVKLTTKEIDRLEDILNKIEIFLASAPKGCLKWQHKDGKIYYYHQYVIDDNSIDKQKKTNMESNHNYKREYIKKDSSLAEALAQKQYYKALKPVIEKNLLELKRFVKSYQDSKVSEIYDTLSDERKELVKPIQIDVNEKLKKWREETYEKCSMYPENLRYETEQGDLVRSKSEVIISNILYRHKKDILYKYERPLTLTLDRNTKTIYPDFTIINIHTGRIVYWEHAGRMDDLHYVSEFVKKINGYIANGFEIGKDVVLTFETQGNSLDISVVKKIVEGLIEERA